MNLKLTMDLDPPVIDGILGQDSAIQGQFDGHTPIIEAVEAKVLGWPQPTWEIGRAHV